MRYFISLFLFLSLSFSYAETHQKTASKTQSQLKAKKRVKKSTRKLASKASRKPASKKPLSFEDIKKSIALIITGSENNISTGSGFFITKSLLVTNSHVVENALSQDGVKLVFIKVDDDITDVGFVVTEDKSNDLAIIKTTKKHKALQLGKYNKTKIGQDIFVFGSPHGLFGTLSKGIISAKRKDKKDEILQITAPISQGSSGSPVLSKDLKVIGIAVAVSKDGQNINFAVPVTYLKRLIRDNKQALVKVNKINLAKEFKETEKQFEQKLTNLKNLAKNGSAEAQFILGGMYYQGDGVTQDYKQAFYWYKKSALQGHAGAQLIVGFMYSKGQGVPQDYISSYAWLNLAANNGIKPAQKLKDKLSKLMSASQMAQAQKYSTQISQQITQRQLASE